MSEHFNCETFEVFCTLNHQASVVAHNGHATTSPDCGSSAVSPHLHARTAGPVRPHNRDIGHRVQQLGSVHGQTNSWTMETASAQRRGSEPARPAQQGHRPSCTATGEEKGPTNSLARTFTNTSINQLSKSTTSSSFTSLAFSSSAEGARKDWWRRNCSVAASIPSCAATGAKEGQQPRLPYFASRGFA